MSGVVVLDTSCIKHLKDPATRRYVQGSLRATDLRLLPSTINLFEIAKHPAPGARQPLLEALAAIAGSQPLLPWPMDLLRELGSWATLDQPGRFRVPRSGFEWALDPPLITPELEAKAGAYMDGIEETFNRIHEDARRHVQPELRKRRLLDAWPDPRAFLESQWRTPDQVGYLVSGVWEQLGLPGEAPTELLLDRCESWRLAIEGFAFSVYERAVKVQQPRRVSQADLLQLVYLGGCRRRILVSADDGLLRAGRAILDGRYPGARTMSWEEFAEAAGCRRLQMPGAGDSRPPP